MPRGRKLSLTLQKSGAVFVNVWLLAYHYKTWSIPFNIFINSVTSFKVVFSLQTNSTDRDLGKMGLGVPESVLVEYQVRSSLIGAFSRK